MIAAASEFSQVTVTRYGKAETIAAHAFTCLWYSVTGTAPVTVILIRDTSKTGYDLALVTNDDQRGEGEAAPALDDLGNAVDLNHALLEV